MKLRLIAPALLLLSLCSCFANTSGVTYLNRISESKDSLVKKKPFVIAEFQYLRSTHHTFFPGVDIVAGYNITKSFSLGLGVEYSHCNLHHDNGWELTDLRFVPIYIDARLNLTRNRLITPFIHIATGVSFIKYMKRDDFATVPPHLISESGLYTYAGFGLSVRASKRFRPFVGVGFKGFHMSTYDLEVNPHGVHYRIGFKFG